MDPTMRARLESIPIDVCSVTRAQLAREWGVSDRQARKILEALRADPGDDPFIIVTRPDKEGGYFRTDCPALVRAYARDTLTRAMNMLQPLRRVRRVLEGRRAASGRVPPLPCQLYELRVRAGISQPRLVEIVRQRCPAFDRVVLSKAENGAAVLPPDVLAAVAEALKVDWTEIYPGFIEAYIGAACGMEM